MQSVSTICLKKPKPNPKPFFIYASEVPTTGVASCSEEQDFVLILLTSMLFLWISYVKKHVIYQIIC